MKKVFLLSALLLPAISTLAGTAFDARLAELGISKSKCTDYSSSAAFTIAEPTCAYANITVSALPTTTSGDQNATIDFYDNAGDYFQKKIILGLQSDEDLPKVSLSVDLCEDEWIGDETTDITFGDWVAQDSYHLKGFYEDGVRGTAEVAYQLYSQMTGRTNCYPKAFPVALYVNGEFYGMMSWQLKKHRDNYGLDKKTSSNVWLDGKLSNKNLWRGTIDWTSFEVRNPKDLYDMSGEDYDGDNPLELMDETSPAYNEDKGKHVRCAEAKAHIQALSQYDTTLVKLAASGATTATMQTNISKYFDVTELVNYRLFSLVTDNYDGFSKNWQWFTTDGVKWSVAPYGCELTFGYNDDTEEGYSLWSAYQGSKKYNYEMTNSAENGPMRWITAYYQTNLKTRYAELRNSGVISVDNISSLFSTWYNRIGETNYNLEWTRWSSSPIQMGNQESLQRIENWIRLRIILLDSYFGYSSTYELSVSDAGWATICLPIATSAQKGMTVYKVTGTNGSALTISQVSSLEANKPYLVKANAGSTFSFKGTPIAANPSADGYLQNGLLIGTYADEYVPVNSYVLQKHDDTVAFFHATDADIDIEAYHAYLALSSSESAALRDYYTLEEEEGISQVDTDSKSPESIYTVSGLRSNSLHNGLNIIRYSDGSVKKVLK